MKLGKQYGKDDEFKKKARLHQSLFRAETLKVDCDVYGNMLKEQDGRKGLNFYSEFNVLDAVHKRYGETYNKQLYSNLLRSEHIPFNLFVPLRYDLDFVKKVFNELLSNTIGEILNIEIEYAPYPKERYLNDRTSFDTYIEYTHVDGKTGIFGIEVKYTEQGYPLKVGSTEDIQVHKKDSEYWSVTNRTGLFKPGIESELIKDDYRQIWRNHILGESVVQNDKINHFTSITMYPEGNIHFRKSISEYQCFLKNKDILLGITYEEYFSGLSKFSPGKRYKDWIDYMEGKYIIK